jgi:hypothetical protein
VQVSRRARLTLWRTSGVVFGIAEASILDRFGDELVRDGSRRAVFPEMVGDLVVGFLLQQHHLTAVGLDVI